MAHLRTQDLHDVLDVSRYALACDSLADIQEDILARIERSFGARSSAYASFNKSQQQISILEGTGHGVPDGSIDRWCADYHNIDPFMRRYLTCLARGHNEVVVSNDVIRHRDYVASAFYNDFMKPQSVYHVMIIGLESELGPIGVFGLHRPIYAPAFSRAEVAKANLLIPHLKGAVERVMAREMANECRWINDLLAEDLAQDGILIFDRHMQPLYISPSARALLHCRDVPPDDLIQACCTYRSQMNGTPDGEFLYRYKNRSVRVSVRSTEGNERTIIRLDASITDLNSDSKMASRMKALGLSRREMDVAQLLGQGLTSASIADQLCISVRTVNNHLRSVYEKAGVHNRTRLLYVLSASQD